MRVLVIEDEDDLRFAVASALRDAGFAVDEAAGLDAADEALFVNRYDCAVFDRMLGRRDAVDYVREMRQSGGSVPVLFLTARGLVDDRIAGFAAGGDDYLVKPFVMPELVARVRSLCRRSGSLRPAVTRVADLEVDTGRHQVRRDGVLLMLTAKEFSVLEVLAANADQAVRRGELIERCWDELTEPNSNALEVLVSQLRRKLGDPPLIHTVRGVGYRLTADPAPAPAPAGP